MKIIAQHVGVDHGHAFFNVLFIYGGNFRRPLVYLIQEVGNFFKLISLSLENPPARIRIFFFIYSTKIISKSKFTPVLFFTFSLTKSINFFISL